MKNIMQLNQDIHHCRVQYYHLHVIDIIFYVVVVLNLSIIVMGKKNRKCKTVRFDSVRFDSYGGVCEVKRVRIIITIVNI